MAAGLALALGAAAALGQMPPDRGAGPSGDSGGDSGGGLALVIGIDGAIGPATADHFARGLAEAEERGAELVILRMDTPGGLADSMRTIIRAILASPIPVVSFVAPPGARAASAGTYILYASHVAAMAPGTNLGAATPIQIGGPPAPLPGGAPEGEEGGPDDGATPPEDAGTAKAINDAVAYIRGLAELRGRNAEWAERAVREAASLPAQEALDRDVIDLTARSIEELLPAIDGRTVMIDGRPVTLDTRGIRVEAIEPGWFTELLGIITNPNVAFILMMIGIYGLIFEFANPGAVVPGVVGAISLILGFYAINILPVNYAGLALLGVGVALMVAEAFVPSFGVLGIGGAVAFVLGAAFLFDADLPAFQLAWPVIVAAAALTGGLMIFLLGYVWRAHRRPVVTGIEQLRGAHGVVLDWADGSGFVHVGGERWHAVGVAGLKPGQPVRVRDKRDLTLIVEPETVEPEDRRTTGALP